MRASGPAGLLLRTPLPPRPRLDFLQPVAGVRIKVKIVKPLQLLNAFERSRTKRRLSIEGMKHNALQKIAKRHVVILGEGLENLKQTLLHPHPGLHPLHQQFRIIDHWYQYIMVDRYKQPKSSAGVPPAGSLP